MALMNPQVGHQVLPTPGPPPTQRVFSHQEPAATQVLLLMKLTSRHTYLKYVSTYLQTCTLAASPLQTPLTCTYHLPPSFASFPFV